MFNKLSLVLSVAIIATSAAFAEEVTIFYSDGTSYRGDLRLDAQGLQELIIDGKAYSIDMNAILRCEGPGCPKDSKQSSTQSTNTAATGNSNGKTFGVYGSNTIGAELIPRLIESYADTQDAQIDTIIGDKPEESLLNATDNDGKILFSTDLRAHGSGTAFPALASGAAEIGMASRAIKDKEIATLKADGIDNMRESGQEHVLGLDGLIVIVSQDNPIKTLSMQQIAQLFSGKISNWSAVGGPDKPVTIYARDDNSGTYDTFKSLMLKPNKAKLSTNAKRFESNEDLSDAVAADSGGIGFTGFAYLRNAKALSLATDCGISYEPDIFGVKTEEYPLARRLYLYTTGKPLSSHAQGLLNYALSDEAQPVIADTGFIDQSVMNKPFKEQGQRTANTIKASDVNLAQVKQMFNRLEGAERLSTTFRFQTGSANLDVKAQQDIQRMAKLLADDNSELAGREIYLLGFSDSVGSAATNNRLSKKRALQVKKTLDKLLPKQKRQYLQTFGYGELSPIACNTDKAGQRKNRRVEVWIK